MKHIFANLKPYWWQAIIIFALLVAQAFCDFSLPNYTSDLIDVGIINSGIEYATPDKLTEDSFNGIKSIMTENEHKEWESAYEKTADGIYELKSKETKKVLDETFTMPIASYYMMRQMMSQMQNMTQEELAQMGFDGSGMPDIAEIRAGIDEKLSELGDTMVNGYAKSFTKDEYETLNENLTKMRSKYLWKMGAKMLLFAFGMMAISVLVGFLASKIGAAVGRDLRKNIFAKVVGFSDAEINKFSTASLITRTTNDIQQVQMMTVMLLRMVMYAPILAVGGIIMVVRTGSGMGGLVAGAVGAIFVVIAILMVLALPKFKIMQKLVDRVNLVSREILTGIPVVRAFSREKHEEERFDQANKELTGVMLFTNRVMTFLMPALMIIMNCLSILIVWIAAHRIDTGAMEIGTMTAFITYAMMIVMAFLMLTVVSVMLPRAGVAAERIAEVLNTEVSVNDEADARKLENVKGVLEFNHVNFRYPGADADVLEDIDFKAMPGTTTAIIGSTGCGKTTLVNLVPRFFDVTKGSITIDGQNVKNVTMESLRDNIGYVPQKGILFSGTIESNIMYGNPNGSEEEMLEAAQIAQAEDFINEKSEKYNSNIAQGGTNVSGGQKQRLSIARAIAKNPQIFIFDDSFSALDFKTDVALRKALGPKVKDKTVLIVAQRISTILYAEQIIVLDEGKIVGKGTHSELMENCDVYKQIAMSQLSEKELEVSKADTSGKEGKEA